MKFTFYFLGVLFITSCANTKYVPKKIAHQLKDNRTFLLTEKASDISYGFSANNPIQVGGVDVNEGPLNEQRFLNALAGPNGEPVSYYRANSCCPTKSDNAIIGKHVLLDNYRVTWKGSEDTVSIYINMYDYSAIKIPVGFTTVK